MIARCAIQTAPAVCPLCGDYTSIHGLQSKCRWAALPFLRSWYNDRKGSTNFIEVAEMAKRISFTEKYFPRLSDRIFFLCGVLMLIAAVSVYTVRARNAQGLPLGATAQA